MTFNTQELARRTAGIARAPQKQTQPDRPEVPPPVPPILFGVVLTIPGEDARFVEMGFVVPTETYGTDGSMEFLTRNNVIFKRPVRCEPNTTAGPYYGRYLWSGPTNTWNSGIVVLRVYSVAGELYAEQRGRRRFIDDTGVADPSDCYAQGSA